MSTHRSSPRSFFSAAVIRAHFRVNELATVRPSMPSGPSFAFTVIQCPVTPGPELSIDFVCSAASCGFSNMFFASCAAEKCSRHAAGEVDGNVAVGVALLAHGHRSGDGGARDFAGHDVCSCDAVPRATTREGGR
eukprot:583891-Prymnesium_polylepis.1